MRRRPTRSAAHAVLAALIALACDGGEAPPVPGSLTAVAGNQQTAVVGTPVATAPAAMLKDTRGRPMRGVSVSFAVTTGGGSLAGATTVKTGTDGVARAGVWTLGTAAATNTITATVEGLPPAVFTAAAVAGAPAAILITAGNGQTATVGNAVTTSPAVNVKDSYGNAVPGVVVVFVVTSGGGSISNAQPVTDLGGLASAGTWTLGTQSGPNVVTATVASTLSAAFTATGIAGPATQMAKNAGDDQSIAIASSAPVRPSVIARDQYGNPAAGAVVTFVVGDGGGAITGAVQTTGANGIATVGSWQMGPMEGINTLIAQAPGLEPVTFTATATVALVFTMTVNQGDGQSAPAEWTVPIRPSVMIKDQFGRPASGKVVGFSVASGFGTVVGATATSDTNGIATVGWWRLGASTGANSLVANATGMSPVTFAATAIAPPPGSGYHISIAYVSPPTARQHQAVLNAVTRWQTVITGDLSDLANFDFGPTSCSPAFVNETIDDVLIQVDFSFIDGAGNILGQAGPCLSRTSDILTAVGLLRLDAADLANMEANGTIDDVVTHEIGHVLGFGTGIWQAKSLATFAGTDSSTFTGPLATAAYVSSGGVITSPQGVPLENCKTGVPTTCGPGTRDVHWREAVFNSELMTGYLSGTVRPLSAVTIQSLADMGYTVNTGAADAYTVGMKPLPGLEPPPVLIREAQPDWPIRTIDDARRR